MNFAAVATLAELDALEHSEVVEGYASAERGDPEPGANRGKAFWHGWCNRQRDYGVIPSCAVHRALTRAYVQRHRLEG